MSLLNKNKKEAPKLSQDDFDAFIKRIQSMQDDVIRSGNKTSLNRLLDRLSEGLKVKK
jgi:hypothetical protein